MRRDAPPYGPPAPAPYHPAPHHGPKGRVGPVYTFVKTDPQVMRAELGYKAQTHQLKMELVCFGKSAFPQSLEVAQVRNLRRGNLNAKDEKLPLL